jgi:hypothetical protein
MLMRRAPRCGHKRLGRFELANGGTIFDLDVVRFLGAREAEGVEL